MLPVGAIPPNPLELMERPAFALLGLGLWALVNGSLVALDVSEWPAVSLALGLAGTCAIIVTGTLLARAHWLGFLRFCGEHSIVINLAFFLPMAVTRTLLLRFDVIHDIGLVPLIVPAYRRGRRAPDLPAGAGNPGQFPVRAA